MKAPAFWTEGGPLSVLLAPAGWVWAAASAFRGIGQRAYKAAVPVICVGNAAAGGQGKTPVALSIASYIQGAHFLSKGYGGRAQGPLLVDRMHHDYRVVGDEPLCLAQVAPCWVAKDRIAGAKGAVAARAKCIVMDDGFQDPSLVKDLSLLVVDGHYGFGAGRCIPAGPLREPLSRALSRADAVVLIGPDKKGVLPLIGKKPVLRAHLVPDLEAEGLAGKRVVAFAGIGQPQKFFRTLDHLKARIVAAYALPDHHPYHPVEINGLIAEAERQDAILVTTEKDLVRIPPHQRDEVTVLPVAIQWDNERALLDILSRPFKDME